MSFPQDWMASRRTCLLRYLVEVGGGALESVVAKAVLRVFDVNTRDDIRADLEHLKSQGCVADEWIGTGDGAGALRKVTITDRGEDAAYGRIEVPGVEKSRWKRA